MAAAPRPPFSSLSKEPLPDPCHCPTCGGACGRKIRKKWFRCRPCGLGYHYAPCEAFVESDFPRIDPECGECGYLKEEHGGRQ